MFIGRWLHGYLALWVGLIAIMLVSVPVACVVGAPPIAMIEALGPERAIPAMFLMSPVIGPIWFWFAIRFYFPVTWRLIMTFFSSPTLQNVTPSYTLSIVRSGLADLEADLKSFWGWLRGRA